MKSTKEAYLFENYIYIRYIHLDEVYYNEKPVNSNHWFISDEEKFNEAKTKGTEYKKHNHSIPKGYKPIS